MFQAIPAAPIYVCSVAQNCLAEAYLTQLLRAQDRIRLLSPRLHNRISLTHRKNIVFVIDQCGLELPLSECLKQLRERCSNAKILVLDDEKSTEEIVRLLLMGVHGYVSHTDVPRTLVRAIFCIAANQLWVPLGAFQEFLRQVGCALRKEIHARDTTTPREDEILELVRKRLSNREIADLLKIRVSTVKFHLSNILSKFHANSRRELARAPSGKPWQMLWQ